MSTAPRRDSKVSAKLNRSRRTKEAAKKSKNPGHDPSLAKRSAALKKNSPAHRKLALDYDHPSLASHGLCPGIVGAFGLGYCHSGEMRGRICVPVYDEKQQLLGYAGYWASKRKKPPNGEGKLKLAGRFDESSVIYNLYSIRAQEYLLNVVLVGDHISVFRLYRLGIPAIALSSHDLSPEHLALLRSCPYLRAITILLDGNERGRATAIRIAMQLIHYFYVRVVKVPNGCKPHCMEAQVLLSLLERGQGLAAAAP